ncbi:hypothetical protein B0H14DRAFT_3502954 [Mycena olivaceomarginata]|nr:hypothetical protein B0H14DRAFT_3502954 [Mycena olivaceomarginata]
MFPATIVSAFFLAAATIAPAAALGYSFPCSSRHEWVTPNGMFAYSYSNNSLLKLVSSGAPDNTAPLNSWRINRAPVEMAALGIINVAPSTSSVG